jgi:hypothetical protein
MFKSFINTDSATFTAIEPVSPAIIERQSGGAEWA